MDGQVPDPQAHPRILPLPVTSTHNRFRILIFGTGSCLQKFTCELLEEFGVLTSSAAEDELRWMAGPPAEELLAVVGL